MKTVFLATYNSDSTEGRGYTVTLAAFTQHADAARAIRGRGVMGVGDGDVETLLVYESYNEFDRCKKDELRNKALAKLTSEEREVLGL